MRRFDRPGRSAAYGTRGMAATSAPLATLAAIDAHCRGLEAFRRAEPESQPDATQ